jgi:hypothetical protein
MANYTNTSSVPMSLAVFLATDNYDHDSSTISATSLIKPLRQLILSDRVPKEDSMPDLTQMVASRMGSAIHDGIERAWVNNYAIAMNALGIPKHVINKVKINPTEEELTEDTIPVYLEQRAYKTVGNYTVSGKFDFVGEGRVEDFKSTSVYSSMSGSNDKKYAEQGSIYRWLNPRIITKDEIAIQFIFTDWSSRRARTETNYPPQRFQQKIIPLMSVAETDRFVKKKLEQFDQLFHADECDLPLCTDDELWRSDPVFKYYKNPEKTARSTKNFDNKQDAYIFMSQQGGQGIVVEQPGQVTACKYCTAFPLCSQKDALIAQGDLIL